MKKKIMSVIASTLSVLLIMGCTNLETKEEENEKIKIVTTFYPIYISTLNVVKDVSNVEVVNMTKAQTGCLHDYQLTPEDLKTVENADAIVINGAGMESFIDKILESNKDIKVINASEGIEVLYEEETEHHHEVGEELDHEHGLENGHVWVSVTNVKKQVENIAKGLEAIDNENKAKFDGNATEYINKLEELRVEMHNVLDNITNKNIVTFHESFSYFAKEFDLNVISVVNSEEGNEPSAKEKEEIITDIKEHNVKALFTEPQYESKSVQSIANETGAKVYEIDPVVTGDSNISAIDDYINIMKENLNVLKEALK